MRRRISTHLIGSLQRSETESIAEGFRRIKEAGFDSIDFNFEMFSEYDSLTSIDGRCFYDKMTFELDDYFAKYKSEAYLQGLTVLQSHAPFLDYLSYIKDEAAYEHFVKVTNKVIESCKVLGCAYIVVHPLCSALRDGKSSEWELNKKYFSALLETARKSGCRICIENIFTRENGAIRPGFSSDVDTCNSFIDEMNAAAGEDIFGLCFDFGHASLLHKDIEEFIVKADKRLKVVHLHDNDGTEDMHGIPYTYLKHWGGSPINDWNSLIKGLKKIQYEGGINFETGPALCSVPDPIADSLRRHVAEVGKYICKELDKE